MFLYPPPRLPAVNVPTATEIVPVLLRILGDGRRHDMDFLIRKTCEKMDVSTRNIDQMYKPIHHAKSMLKKLGFVKVEYHGGPVIITPSGKKSLSHNPSVTMAEAAWIATAILHRDYGADELFTVGQIADMVDDRKIYTKPHSKTSLQTAITGTCVANTNATSANHRLLYRAKQGRYRLYHKGDDHHKSRKGGLTCPKPNDLPSKYKGLVKWYKDIYNKREMGDGQVVKRLASKPESDTLEFKSSLRYSKKGHCVDNKLEDEVARTIAGFLNSKGGNLLIGVDDHGTLLGLEDDFGTLGRRHQPVDDFQQRILTIIDNQLGRAAHLNITIKMVQVEGKDICHCIVSKSPTPTYLDRKGEPQQFLVRNVNTTRPLNIKDAVTHILKHFHDIG